MSFPILGEEQSLVVTGSCAGRDGGMVMGTHIHTQIQAGPGCGTCIHNLSAEAGPGVKVEWEMWVQYVSVPHLTRGGEKKCLCHAATGCVFWPLKGRAVNWMQFNLFLNVFKLSVVTMSTWGTWRRPSQQRPSAHQRGEAVRKSGESLGYRQAGHSTCEAEVCFSPCTDAVSRERRASSPRPGSANAKVLQMLLLYPSHISHTVLDCNSPFAAQQMAKFGVLSQVSRRLLSTLFLLTEQWKSWALAQTTLLLQMKKRVKEC